MNLLPKIDISKILYSKCNQKICKESVNEILLNKKGGFIAPFFIEKERA